MDKPTSLNGLYWESRWCLYDSAGKTKNHMQKELFFSRSLRTKLREKSDDEFFLRARIRQLKHVINMLGSVCSFVFSLKCPLIFFTQVVSLSFHFKSRETEKEISRWPQNLELKKLSLEILNKTLFMFRLTGLKSKFAFLCLFKTRILTH